MPTPIARAGPSRLLRSRRRASSTASQARTKSWSGPSWPQASASAPSGSASAWRTACTRSRSWPRSAASSAKTSEPDASDPSPPPLHASPSSLRDQLRRQRPRPRRLTTTPSQPASRLMPCCCHSLPPTLGSATRYRPSSVAAGALCFPLRLPPPRRPRPHLRPDDDPSILAFGPELYTACPSPIETRLLPCMTWRVRPSASSGPGGKEIKKGEKSNDRLRARAGARQTGGARLALAASLPCRERVGPPCPCSSLPPPFKTWLLSSTRSSN